MKNRVLKSRNGRVISAGSTITYDGDRCYIYDIEPDGNVALERLCDGISWGGIEPQRFDAKWINL